MPAKKAPQYAVVPIRMPAKLWRDVRRVARKRYDVSGAELCRAALRIVVELPEDAPAVKEAA